MKIGPKYKIARRLGAPVFEKTQSPKYALSLARKERTRRIGRGRPKTEFGLELNEKQKARFTYGLSERQFGNYVKRSARAKEPIQALFVLLEKRLDNILYRAGFAKTRREARQMASHGHILQNGKKVTIPSIELKEGDILSLRASSTNSTLFADISERMKTMASPSWLVLDPDKREVTVKGEPVYMPQEQVFDLGVVIEFYSR